MDVTPCEIGDAINGKDGAVCRTVQHRLRAQVRERAYFTPMEDYHLDPRRYGVGRLGIDPDVL
jgi:hypothetical protein